MLCFVTSQLYSAFNRLTLPSYVTDKGYKKLGYVGEAGRGVGRCVNGVSKRAVGVHITHTHTIINYEGDELQSHGCQWITPLL